jgi:UDP-glucuronate decarboxylase
MAKKLYKKILITGGAGFLGSHLCERLLDQGDIVFCVDDLSTGNKQNIIHLLDNPRFKFMQHDVTLPLDVHVDEIYNLACPASTVHYQSDPVKTLKTNIYGMINMLDLARQSGAKILQVSTSEVYGDPEIHPQHEGYWGKVNPIGIRSCYAEGKRCAETLCYDYYRQYQLDIKILRLFNAYGSRLHYNAGSVVSNFIIRAIKGDDIIMYGDGTQTRSFCYVDDVVDAFMLMMNTGNGFKGPVNIGNQSEITMMELADKILSIAGGKSRIVFKPLTEDDPKKRMPDTTQAKERLNWVPKVSIENGLKMTIAYFKQYILS